MATGSSSGFATLSLRLATQSGPKVLTAAWQTVYSGVGTNGIVYIFEGGNIDLSNMQGGDTVNIRLRQIIVQGGGYVILDQVQYNGVQPVTHPVVHIPAYPDVYGFDIGIQQTAGVLRTVNCLFFEAKRVGI